MKTKKTCKVNLKLSSSIKTFSTDFIWGQGFHLAIKSEMSPLFALPLISSRTAASFAVAKVMCGYLNLI